MKKTILRVASAALAVLMTVSVAGCGTRYEETSVWVEGEGNTTTVTHSSGTSGTEATTSTVLTEWGLTDASGIDDKEDLMLDGKTYDLKGAEVVLAAWGDSGLEPDPTSETYQEEMDLIADVEEKYNCTIRFKHIVDSMAYQSSWVAAAQSGVKFCDILQSATSWIWPTHMKNGYIHEMGKYVKVNNAIFNQDVMEQFTYKGKHYAVVLSSRYYVGSGLFFNKSVFNKLGLEKTPYDYVKEGNWNWDTALELIKKCNTTVGDTKYWGTEAYMMGGNGGKIVQNIDGKYVFEPNDQWYKEWQYQKDLRDVHKIYPDDGSKFANGNVAMVADSQWHLSNRIDQIGVENVGFTFLPKGPDVNDYQCITGETTSFAIPATVENPEAMCALFCDYFYPYKWKQTALDNAEATWPDEDAVNSFMGMAERHRQQIDLSPLYTYITRKLAWGGEGYGLNTGESAQAYIARVRAEAQAELDRVWDQ